MDSTTSDSLRDVFLERFGSFVDRVGVVDWKKCLNEDYKLYNIKQYTIEKLSGRRAKELYAILVDKFYVKEKESEAWHENELRVFVWVLMAFGHSLRLPLNEFTDLEWEYLSTLFYGKNARLCEFQYLNLKKTQVKNERWSQEEDEYLIDIISSKAQKNKWNEIAKEIFYRSDRQYFRSAKQCRERWNNYLDPQKTRGAWTTEEDIILISGVRKEGKKWAYIAKCLQDTRTEHTVKNRYKSILTRFRKELKERRLTCERDLLSVIYERLQAMTNQSILLSPEEEIMEEIEVSQEIRMPQEPVKTIQSCSQLTDVPGDEYPTLSFKQEPSQQVFGEWLEFEDFHQRRSPSLDCGFIEISMGGLSEESDIF